MRGKILSAVGAASGIALLASGAAMAGGYVEPVVAPEPVVVEQPAPVGDWAGAYVGAALGYAFGGDDSVGFRAINSDGDVTGRANDVGSVDLKGANLGAHVGYRWQRDNWVFGPELAIEGGAIEEDGSTPAFGVEDLSTEAKVNYLVGLRMKTGYAINPSTLVYGTFGVAHGDFDYTVKSVIGSETESFSDTGVTAGLGVERKLNERLSMFGEWEYRHFENTDVKFDEAGLVTTASPAHHNLKIGVNYRF